MTLQTAQHIEQLRLEYLAHAAPLKDIKAELAFYGINSANFFTIDFSAKQLEQTTPKLPLTEDDIPY